jgi:superfamily II DNA or RNA helicase
MATYDIVKMHLNMYFQGMTNADEITKLISADKHKHYIIYECAAADKYGMVLWTHLSNDTLDNIGAIRSTVKNSPRDMGIDCASEDLSQVLQAKYYGENSRITWRTISTFYMYSDSLNIGQNGRLVVYPEHANLDNALNIVDKLKFEIMEEKQIELLINKVLNLPAEKKDYEYNVIDDINDALPFEEDDYEEDEDEDENDVDENDVDDEEDEEENKNIDKIVLRDYQNECITELIKNLYYEDDNDDVENEQRITRMQLACGLGKSFIIASAIQKIYSFIKKKCLILVPSRALLHQMKRDFNTLAPELSVGLVGDGCKQLDKDIIICVYNSMAHVMDIEFNICVVDEAHHFENENTWRDMMDNLNCFRFGFFSATLFNDDTEIDFERNINFGVENGYLCDYTLMVPVFREDTSYMSQLAELIILHPEWTHILAYCNSLESAKQFNDLLNDAGILSSYFDGSYNIEKRNEIINVFNESKVRVLATVAVISEGLNIPIANTCLFVEPRSSAINVNQCVGRVSRLHKTKKMSYVVLPSVNEDVDLRKFLKIMSGYDNRLRSIKKQSAKLNVMYDLIKESNEGDTSNNELLYVKIYENVRSMMDFGDADEKWVAKYNELKEFVEINNKIPFKSENKELGHFIYNQRTNYKNNKLLKSRKLLLEEIKGWVWINNNTWNENFYLFKKHVEEFNQFSNTITNKKLARWYNKIDYKYRKNELADDKIKMFESINGFKWKNVKTYKIESWETSYNNLINYINLHGLFPIDIRNKIHKWVSHQKTAFSNKKLIKEKINKLEEIEGWKWSIDLSNTWYEKFNLLRSYIEINGELPNISTNKNLYEWIRQCKSRFNDGSLTVDKINLLESLNIWKWSKTKNDIVMSWMDNFNLLKDYLENDNKLPVVTDKKFKNWIRKNKYIYKENKLSKERIDLLESINGWKW